MRDRAWCFLLQAESDLNTGIFISTNQALCQSISKFQQATEKSIKAIFCAFGMSPKKVHETDRYISAFLRAYLGGYKREIKNAVHGIFNPPNREGVRLLEAITPSSNEDAINTEYPFIDAAGKWHSPNEEGIFTQSEADYYKQLARRIHIGCIKVVSSLERFP